MKNFAQRRLAEEAARLMAEGVESEYLHAKERAASMLGLSSQARLPTNRQIKEYIGQFTKNELGPEQTARQLQAMREIAEEIMSVIENNDPFLIGSTLTGEIRNGSDIDLHAYCDDYRELKDSLAFSGYEGAEEELVENIKGSFVHLRWYEGPYPVEITVYPWSWRHIEMISSVTGKPMKRAAIGAVRRLISRS
jgi:predicted nucleotidyltransferase